METRLGQAAPCFVAAEAISAACLPVLEMEAVAEGPCRAPDSSSCPEEASASELSPRGLPVPVGCPVPVLFLSCPVCLAPEGS